MSWKRRVVAPVTAAAKPLAARARLELNRRGFDLKYHVPFADSPQYPADFDVEAPAIAQRVAPYTMTSKEAVNALCTAVRYLTEAKVAGDIVECGVWKGGSSMAAALMLDRLGDRTRTLHLFDTFEGMTEPGARDVSIHDEVAVEVLAQGERQRDDLYWCYSPIDEVGKAMMSTGYPTERVRLVKGPVEVTLPAEAPELVALARLDTDWYESTRHELEHLVPRLAPGAVLIIDDYGYWRGARGAVDEFFANEPFRYLASRIDGGVRMGVVQRR